MPEQMKAYYIDEEYAALPQSMKARIEAEGGMLKCKGGVLTPAIEDTGTRSKADSEAYLAQPHVQDWLANARRIQQEARAKRA